MIIVIVISVLLLIYIAITYNGFISLRNRAGNAWADIDVQLKRRYDLIPNLVEVVRAYAEHEKAVFEDVARLRSQAMQATETSERGGSENMLSSAIKKPFLLLLKTILSLKQTKIFATFRNS